MEEIMTQSICTPTFTPIMAFSNRAKRRATSNPRKEAGEKLDGDETGPQNKESNQGKDDESKPLHVLRAPGIAMPESPGE
jgi:hypothetical protein